MYVFGVIQEEHPQKFGTVQMSSEERQVYSIHFQNVGVVICPVDEDVLPTRDNLFAHSYVVSNIMGQYNLIPMSFGNVFKSEEDVMYLIKHLYDEFQKLFPQLENKIEVGLKIIANQEWINTEIKKDSVLQKLKEDISKKSDASAYYDKIKLGELAQKFMFSLQNNIEKDIYEPLSSLAQSSKLNHLTLEKMLLNAAFLIDRKDESEFDKKVNELYTQWKDKVEFKYTGPWPAYNFVNIRLRIEGEA